MRFNAVSSNAVLISLIFASSFSLQSCTNQLETSQPSDTSTPTKTSQETSQETVTVAQAMKDITGLTIRQKIDMLIQNKGKFGSGNALRRFFFGDLEPLSIQPGGAGMVVNLYNKANNTTFAYCTTYDVVVAIKEGKINTFPSEEVK